MECVMMAGHAQSLPGFITEKGRDLRIDLLRGYFVFAMVVDHVCGASPLWLLTGGNRFFFGAAEGFILTSGLVTGLVYARLIRRDGMGRSFMKVLARALKLYLLTLALTLILLPLSELLRLPWAQGVDTRDPVAVLVEIVTLHRTYYLVDVMLLYTIVFLLTPLALVLLDQSKRWWLLGGSWLLWALFQRWPDYAALPWPIAGNYLFNFSAWQALFFTGLAFGYGRRAMPVPRPRVARLWLVVTGAVLGGMIALFVLLQTPGAFATPVHSYDLRTLLSDLFLDKVDVRPGRVFAAGVTFTFLFLAVTVFWPAVRRAVGWLLLPLGQHALYAYTVHVGLVVLAALALAPLQQRGGVPMWLNALVQVASVGVVWLLARHQVLAPTPRTQRLYNLSPILFAALAEVALAAVPVPASGLSNATVAAAAAPVNRFGTPIPPTPAPAANPFGTPIPATAAPAEAQAPQATPTPEAWPADPSQALARVAPWVGEIQGTLEEHWFYSRALDREMPYWAYLPPGYNTASARYATVYLLHGAGGHRDEWINYGAVSVADREMASGVMPPMILIMPQGDRGFWVNNVGGPRWGDYVTQDLIAQVDATFRTLPEPQARAVGGLSMGGYGALTLAFTHPDLFGVVAANTPSLHTESADVAFLGSGDEFAARDPVSLAATLPGLDRLRIWIDIDDHDNWLARAQELHDTLDRRGIPHTWNVYPGEHDWAYWTAHVLDYLRFYASALEH